VPGGPAIRERPWRNLEVHVTPKKIRVSLGGEGYEFPREFIMEKIAKILDGAVDPLIDNQKFADRDGLGLMVWKAAASFKSVVVEPFVETD
jgi:hypothetical protein